MLPKVNHFYLCEIFLSLPLIFHEIISAVIALSSITKTPSIWQWNTTYSATDSKQQWMDLEWKLRVAIILIVISCYSRVEKQFFVPTVWKSTRAQESKFLQSHRRTGKDALIIITSFPDSSNALENVNLCKRWGLKPEVSNLWLSGQWDVCLISCSPLTNFRYTLQAIH